ncbi:glutamate-rich protein 3-like isoform X3 [Acanthaster planci]|uniref:Glutamate-rich protein 3-like isoform X3 n=1 Tax=Acanthaster planci TaxID=133434 RepID=A0A8B7ZL98_ACAPL|nr:glutamate-rich protein 3-like isoform X3 [Acanthaster planci]
MSHVDSGPLATYNSLQDKHLVGYFNNTRMRRHLRRSGLITRNGEIVTENTFRLNMARKEHQKHVRDLMAQAIVHKALDMERSRQAEIKRKLEEIAKVELVQRVKSSRGRKGDEDITPYLSPRAPSGRPKSAKQERPRSVVTGHRPSTAPSKRSGSAKKKSAIYVDKEGFPIHRDQAWGSSDDGTDEVDSHNLRELDPYALNDITVNMTPEEKQSNSPYKIDLTRDPRPPPRTPQGFKKSPRGTTRGVITRDGRRLRPKSNKGSLSLHRKEPAYPHPTQQQTLCDVTIRYRGNNLKLQYERQDKRDEIIINQQHCGGENLVVFHGLVEPGIDLVFTSRRHRGYPFSLTFFVNSIQVLRLSACCEYKYGPGVMLGGRKGHFKFGRVDGGSPCYRCMVEAELARRERQRYKDTQTEEPKPEPEPEPVLESQGTQSDPPPPDTRDQGEQAEAVDAEAGAYDDDDFEDEDDKEVVASEKGETPKEEDRRSDHFFSGPESDIEQKQPEEADYGADSDFEADSHHEKEDEKELDKEMQDEDKEAAEEILAQGVAEDEDALGEISEEEPVKGETNDDNEVEPEDIPEEHNESPPTAEPSQQTEDEHQSSRNDDSDSSSDSDGDNVVLSSSSSSSSSEDENDQQEKRDIKEADASSSEFSSEDEGDVEKKRDNGVKQETKTEELTTSIREDEGGIEEEVKQDIKTEEPSTDDRGTSVAEKRDETIGSNAEEGLDNLEERRSSSPQTSEIDLDNQEEKPLPSPPASENDVQEAAGDEQDQSHSEEEVTTKQAEMDTKRPSSPDDNGKDDEKEDDITKERDMEDRDRQKGEQEDGEDKSIFEKLADKIKDAFTSSDSSSSDSDSEERQKKKKRETKGTPSTFDKDENSKTESDSNSEKKKSFFERLKDKFTSSDSDSESDEDRENKKKKKRKRKTKSENAENNMDEETSVKDQKPEEAKDPQPENIEEHEKSGRAEEAENQHQETEDKKEPDTPPKEEKEEEKGWLDKMESKVKGLFRSSDSEDEGDEKKTMEEVKKSDEEASTPEDKQEEEKGWLDKMESAVKGFFGASDSEDSDESKRTKEAQKTVEESKEEDHTEQEARPSSPEPHAEETGEMSPPNKVEVKANDMFGPSDSEDDNEAEHKDEIVKTDNMKEMPFLNPPGVKANDTFETRDSDSKDDKEDEKVEIIKAEEDAETGAVPMALEEELARDSELQEESKMQPERDERKGKEETASLGKEDADVSQTKDGDMEKSEDEGPEEERKDEVEKTWEDKEQEISPSDRETGPSAQEVETKMDEVEDKVNENKDTGDRDSIKEEKPDDGSLSSRSSFSDTSSIAAGLEKDYRVLNLNDKNLDESKTSRLAKALKSRKYRNLEYLLLRGNPLGDSGVANVIQSLIEGHNTATSPDSALKLTHFDLGNTAMGDEAAGELGRLLSLDTQLRNLNISENTLSATAWESINQGLKVNKTLVTFSAEYARLSDTSCVMMTQAVMDHERLEELNIEGNGLGERAGNALAQLVKDNSVILTINMERDNSIPSNILAEVKEILETGSYVP